jgi:sortase A
MSALAARFRKGIWLLLVLAGLGLALYPLYTDLYARYQQGRLAQQVEEAGAPAPQEPVAPAAGTEEQEEKEAAPEELPGAQAQPAAPVKPEAMFTLRIPRIGVEAVVVRGTSRAVLRYGPGWYEQSALPGQGNTAVAGHRTMYGAWFRHVDRLQAGDEITLAWRGQLYRYRVEKVYPVANNDWSVIRPVGYPVLTLTTCHPPGSARQRLVVRAALVAQNEVQEQSPADDT